MRRPSISPLLTLALALSLCSIGSNLNASEPSTVRKMTEAEFGPPDQTDPDKPAVEYRIGPMDKLSVSVLQLPDLPKEQEVDANGDILMPLIGTVHAAGLTADELGARLKEKFGERYLQAPTIQVAIVDALGDRVTVDGAVNAPGVYSLNGANSLLDAVALAKGLSEKAVPSRVAVFRTIDGKRMAAGFDLKKIRKGLQADPPIYGNDLIVVDGSNLSKHYQRALSVIPILAIFGLI
jgi:polysaccharide export outer membrane protein